MRHVLSLIAPGSKAVLTADDVDAARRALDAAPAPAGAPIWLSAGEACEVPFEGDASAGVSAVRAALAGRQLDVNTVPGAARRKRLLVADMDSTLVEQECVDELAAEIGMRDRVAAITARAMRGEIDFEPALRERVALLAGLPVETVARLLAGRITDMPGAAVLVATMRAAGAHTALVSGGFTAFAGPIAKRLGFDAFRANTLNVANGAFSGRLDAPILGRAAKEEALAQLTATLGIDPAETLAVGDGANDIGMLRRAGLGVAYRAKPAVRAAAGAVIEHADLTALLFLQGYRREEFVLPS